MWLSAMLNPSRWSPAAQQDDENEDSDDNDDSDDGYHLFGRAHCKT